MRKRIREEGGRRRRTIEERV
jgi:hypothetical protein